MKDIIKVFKVKHVQPVEVERKRIDHADGERHQGRLPGVGWTFECGIERCVGYCRWKISRSGTE